MEASCWTSADGLEFGPGVRPADLQRGLVVEDVVAELVQRRLRVQGGKLSRLLHLFPDGNVDFLTETGFPSAPAAIRAFTDSQSGRRRPHLELLRRRHVVCQHALLQHGDGVALAADLLDLLPRAITAREQTTA